jgi:hypothetical protein
MTCAALQLAQLHHHALPAVDRQHVEPRQVAGVLLEGLGHLDREFARRRQHQACGWRSLSRAAQQRQREGGGLAGAGLRFAEQVAPASSVRDAGGLDRRGRFIANGFQGGKQWRGETKLVKAFDGGGHGVGRRMRFSGGGRRFYQRMRSQLR